MPAEYPYIMNLDSGNITASSNATDTISIGSNYAFEVYELRLTSATGKFSLDITDDTGKSYMQESLHFVVKDNAKDIFRLPIPLQMRPSSEWKFKFTDTSAATNRVRAQLIGIKKLV